MEVPRNIRSRHEPEVGLWKYVRFSPTVDPSKCKHRRRCSILPGFRTRNLCPFGLFLTGLVGTLPPGFLLAGAVEPFFSAEVCSGGFVG